MTKKEKQAEAKLAAAREYVENIKIEKPIEKNILIKGSIKEIKVEITPDMFKKSKSVATSMVFDKEVAKYSQCRCNKIAKGDFRVDVMVNGKYERYPKRFKSVTLAEAWCIKHTI